MSLMNLMGTIKDHLNSINRLMTRLNDFIEIDEVNNFNDDFDYPKLY